MTEQPTNSINTARDLENLIDTYRGQITLQEQSMVQNKKVLTSQEYTIGQNELKLSELKDFISTAEAHKTIVERELVTLGESRDDLSKTVLNLKLEISALNDYRTNLFGDIDGKEAALKAKEEELSSDAQKLLNWEQILTSQEKILTDKNNTIKDFINSIS